MPILEWFVQHGACVWTVWDRHKKVESEIPDPPTGSLTDRVIDALCVEAYGATRASSIENRMYETSRVTFDELPENQWGGVSTPRGLIYASRAARDEYTGSVVGNGYTEADEIPGAPGFVSEWGRRQQGGNPTAETIAGLSGPYGVSVAARENLPIADVVADWRARGLTDAQIQAVYLSNMGYTDREIGQIVHRAESTARQRRTKGIQKIVKSEGAENGEG